MSTPEFFTPLPLDFEQLALAANAKRGSGFGKDPDLRTVGERTYSAFEEVNFSPNSDQPRARDWRHIPYALWLSAQKGLSDHAPLTKHYFDVAVPQAIQTRRPLKWGRGLLHTYLQNFAPHDAVFNQLARAAHDFFLNPKVLDALSLTEAFGLTRFITTLEALDPERGPTQVANDILGMPEDRSLSDWQHHHALANGFWLNPFAQQAFAQALQAPAEVRANALRAAAILGIEAF